jgi:hypothetical protein
VVTRKGPRDPMQKVTRTSHLQGQRNAGLAVVGLGGHDKDGAAQGIGMVQRLQERIHVAGGSCGRGPRNGATVRDLDGPAFVHRL